MIKPNYRQAKRQKELARKVKQEQKLHRRAARSLSAAKESGQDANEEPKTDQPPSNRDS